MTTVPNSIGVFVVPGGRVSVPRVTSASVRSPLIDRPGIWMYLTSDWWVKNCRIPTDASKAPAIVSLRRNVSRASSDRRPSTTNNAIPIQAMALSTPRSAPRSSRASIGLVAAAM